MLVFTFATMTFFGIFAINPTLTTITELQRKLQDLQLVDDTLTQKINTLSLLNNKYSQLSGDVAIVENAVPQTANATYFMGQIQTVIAQSSVTLERVSFGALTLSSTPPIEEGDFAFSIQVSGTFSQVNAFLENLTMFDRIVTLKNLTITKQSAGNATMNVGVEGAAYFKN